MTSKLEINEKSRGGRPCLLEKKTFTIATRLSPDKHADFRQVAHSWGLGMGHVLRRLIKYALWGKIGLADLLTIHEIHDENNKKLPVTQYKRPTPIVISTRLSEKENSDFWRLSNSWDFLPGTLARILIHYLLALDDRTFIWEESTSPRTICKNGWPPVSPTKNLSCSKGVKQC